VVYSVRKEQGKNKEEIIKKLYSEELEGSKDKVLRRL